MVRSYQVFGLELGPYVLDWGAIEEVKDILLAQAQLFTAEHTLIVDNSSNMFSQSNSKSPFYGRNLQLVPVVLQTDGETLYNGFIRSIKLDHANRKAEILTQNAFTKPANASIVLTTTGNPAAVIQTILQLAGLSAYIDPVSFTAAQGGFAAAGATISVAYAAGSNTTALSAIQEISSLCSISCFVQGGLVRLRAWQPYQGNLSGIKYQIQASQVYDYMTLEDAFQNLSNQVTILYGASGALTLTNQQSIQENGITTPTDFSTQTGSALAVPNLVSATYFGNLFLARAATIRRQGSLTCGPELLQANIGDRVTINAPNWGSAAIAFEIIETHRTIQSNSVELVGATI